MSTAPESLDALRARFEALVAALDVSPYYKRFATSPLGDASPHIEYDGHTYAYVIRERDDELERRETRDPDDVLYWLVSDTARESALRFELAHRVPGKDFRRLYFAKHVELLQNIRADWGHRKRQEYGNILKRHPYSDEDC
jgi:hypothetical protein